MPYLPICMAQEFPSGCYVADKVTRGSGFVQAWTTDSRAGGRRLEGCVVVVVVVVLVLVGVVREVIGLLFDDFSREKVVDTKGLLVRRSKTLFAVELLRIHIIQMECLFFFLPLTACVKTCLSCWRVKLIKVVNESL